MILKMRQMTHHGDWNPETTTPDEPGGLLRPTDETDLFVPVDEVSVSPVNGAEQREQIHADWSRYEGKLRDLLSHRIYEWPTGMASSDSGIEMGSMIRVDDGMLVHAVRGEVQQWFLTSQAWLMSDEGKTIERIAP